MDEQQDQTKTDGGLSDLTDGLEDNGPKYAGLTMSVMLERLHGIYGGVALTSLSDKWSVMDSKCIRGGGPTPFAAVYFAYKPHHGAFADKDRETAQCMRELLSSNARDNPPALAGRVD